MREDKKSKEDKSRMTAEIKIKDEGKMIKGEAKMTKNESRMIKDEVKMKEGRKTTAGSGMRDEGRGTTTTRDKANKRNTTNIKKESTILGLTTLKLVLRTGPTKTKRTTREDNSEEYSGRIEIKAARRETMVTKTANTSPPNKNTALIIVWARSLRNLCLFVKKAEKSKLVRVPQVAAIPAITLRNKSSIEANTPMIASLTIKNSTRAAAHEAITDL
jgi:hypothetical protein